MSEVSIVPARRGEVIGDSPERRVEILADDEALNATWSRFGARRDGADLHVHREHTDLFYVLEGELTVRLGLPDEVVTVPAGTLARVPPLVVHGFRNGSDAEVRYLNFHAPGQRFADYLRAMRDGRAFSYDQYEPPPDGGRPASDAVVGGEEVAVDEPGLHATLLTDVDDIGILEIGSATGGTPAPPTHVHHRHAEWLYVLEGELTLTTAESDLRAEAGSWVQVPAGVPHTVSLPEHRPVRFLDVHTPSYGLGTLDVEAI